MFFVFWRTHSFTCPILGPLVPLFWISGDVFSGFQSQSSFCLISIPEANVMYIHSPRFTSGATCCQPLEDQHLLIKCSKKNYIFQVFVKLINKSNYLNFCLFHACSNFYISLKLFLYQGRLYFFIKLTLDC